MIKLIFAMICLALAIAFWPRRSHSADDGWHDIPCGQSPMKQPESYDGPIQCKRGPTTGANAGWGPRDVCSFRQYNMFYGRALKGADPRSPAVYLGADISESNTSRCHVRMSDDRSTAADLLKLGASWAGGRDWMALRKFESTRAMQFVSKDSHRCVGFERREPSDLSIVYGVYCDPADKVPADQPYTDDEIRTRAGAAQLNE